MIDTCYVGDVRDGLRAFIAAGVKAQTCVTSPPYWGLRDYGTAQWDGGDAACDHRNDTRHQQQGVTSARAGRSNLEEQRNENFRGSCGKCGARRVDRQLGLEPLIAEYVANMVEVFRLVRDVLADDGTIWVNLGDSYAGGGVAGSDKAFAGKQGSNRGSVGMIGRSLDHGLKQKDLCGIPWRIAFALQADGWYLRSDIIWHKPNPMPESVTDRPTKAHEYLFLLAKSERYFYDADAIAENLAESSIERLSQPTLDEQEGSYRVPGKTNGPMKSVAKKSDYAAANIPGQSAHGYTKRDDGLTSMAPTGKRNRRTVWTVATQPFSEAHFATFPPALIEPCILAGSRPGDIVLDPFMGSGTTAMVAQSLGRHWIGCELNGAYFDMQKRRTAQLGMELVA